MLENYSTELPPHLRDSVIDIVKKDLTDRLGTKFVRGHLLGATAFELTMAVMTFGLSLLASLPITGITMLARRDGTSDSGLKARGQRCAENMLNGTGMPLPFPRDVRALTSGFLVGVWQNLTRPLSYSLIPLAAVMDGAEMARQLGRKGVVMPMTQSLRHSLWRLDMISPSVSSLQKLNKLKP